MPHDVRDLVVDFVRCWSEKTEIGAGRFIHWLGVRASKFYNWRERYGRVNEHNGWIPRDFWLAAWEKRAIIGFHGEHPLEGYRRLTFMMLDADVVAVSPSSVWRVLGQAGLLSRWKGKPSRKGTGFEQPPEPHQHWHIDISCLNVCATFYCLCSILDGYTGRGKNRCSKFSVLRSAVFSSQAAVFLAISLFVPRLLRPSADTTALTYTAGISFTRRSRLAAVANKRNNQFPFFTPRTFTCRRMLSSFAQPNTFSTNFRFRWLIA